MNRTVAVLLLSFVLAGLVADARPLSLAGVELRLVDVADSSGYYMYDYELENPVGSTWGIAQVAIDIATSSGTPTNLAVVGAFRDGTVGGTSPVAPHAEVGPTTPSGWRAALTREAELWWYPPGDGLFDPDSVAPGDTLTGLGIRSSYLPGISTVSAQPTVQSCCSVPDSLDAYPGLAQFQVTGWTVAPRFMPDEVTVQLLQGQLATVCDDPLWLDDSGLCTEFGDLLDLADEESGVFNYYGAAGILGRLRARVSEEQSAMHPNAYWLLYLDAGQARDNLLGFGAIAADQWHLRNVVDTAVVAGAWSMTSGTQSTGTVESTVSAQSSKWVTFVRPVASSAAFVDGDWSLQLDLIEMSANDGGLSLNDLRVQRYSNTGTLLQTKYLHSGELMTVPAGATRVSVTETLTGWSSGSSSDVLAVSFRFDNDNTDASELFVVRVGVEFSDWEGSWLSQPK